MIRSINVKWITTCFFKSQFAFPFFIYSKNEQPKIFLFICFITAVDFHRKNVNNIFCFISKQKQLLHPHPHSTQYQVNRKKLFCATTLLIQRMLEFVSFFCFGMIFIFLTLTMSGINASRIRIMCSINLNKIYKEYFVPIYNV